MNEDRSTRPLAARLAWLVWLALMGLFVPEPACNDGPPPKNSVGLACSVDTDCAPPASVCCGKVCTAANGDPTAIPSTVCGACGTTCAGSQTCCMTAGEYGCTNASTDIYNCGSCGNVCPTSEDCIDGRCQPPSAGGDGGSDGGGGGCTTTNVCDSGPCAPLGSWQECTMNVPSNPGGGCCQGLTCGYGYPSGATTLALGVCCVGWGASGCQQAADCCAVNANLRPTCNSGKCCIVSGAACDSLSGGTPCCSGACTLNASNNYVCQ